ncbi:chemotaxis protein CheC [Natranaerofaba carboxydovora]|uniref:chemotaxis protein CheC n=1 Tax=Natranaerofaba carboxydovora TaxID=2742683 RepID=UPI001F1303E0|nr:chemotaxis protein CheC [Natranaerofaba carboxydovora]UMZ72782.1 CheY-P phosphatase CheC [Natranaerofaba carboxydovora]
MTEPKINEQKLDVLKEAGNIGAGNAATALSHFLSSRINMSVPEVGVINFDEIADFLKNSQDKVIGVYLKIEGDAPGTIALILDYVDGIKLVNELMKKEVPKDILNKELEEMEISALKETGNITASSYLGALSMLTKLDFQPSTPNISVDKDNSLLETITSQVKDVSDRVLLIETIFSNENNNIGGRFFLIPSMGSFDKILNSLGIE